MMFIWNRIGVNIVSSHSNNAAKTETSLDRGLSSMVRILGCDPGDRVRIPGSPQFKNFFTGNVGSIPTRKVVYYGLGRR